MFCICPDTVIGATLVMEFSGVDDRRSGVVRECWVPFAEIMGRDVIPWIQSLLLIHVNERFFTKLLNYDWRPDTC